MYKVGHVTECGMLGRIKKVAARICSGCVALRETHSQSCIQYLSKPCQYLCCSIDCATETFINIPFHKLSYLHINYHTFEYCTLTVYFL